MRRHLLGIIGLVLLALAAILFPLSANDNDLLWPSACLRIGLVLVVLWMAWPEIAAMSQWIGPAAIVVALVLAATVKNFGVLIPVLVGVWLLWFIGRWLKPLPKPPRKRVNESSDREVPS